MALFEVPGWTVPTAPVPGPSTKAHKRKRHDTEREPQEDNEAKIQAAAANIEKLISSLGSEETVGGGTSKKNNRKKVKGKEAPSRKGEAKVLNGDVKPKGQSTQPGKRRGDAEPRVSEKTESTSKSPERPAKKQKKGKGDAKRKDVQDEFEKDLTEPSRPPQKHKDKSTPGKGGLTALQANMKQSLDGARFRWINETLYKSDSASALDMMRENPSVFTEYHTGFRHQVQSWPANPVSHYVSNLSSYPSKTVIADLGCGDAALARALTTKGLTVLSYDLVSDGAFVVEADVCSKIPLPGAESVEDTDQPAQVVDVVVFALSLMSTNWVGSIREAWRVLKLGGELKIAEVASRFTEVDAFVSLISSVGFKLRSKDDTNSHFTLFEFSKVKRKPKSDKEWAKLSERGSVLKPCEYKRR